MGFLREKGVEAQGQGMRPGSVVSKEPEQWVWQLGMCFEEARGPWMAK